MDVVKPFAQKVEEDVEGKRLLDVVKRVRHQLNMMWWPERGQPERVLMQSEHQSLDPPNAIGAPMHFEIWKYCKSTSKVQGKVLQNLRVPCANN